MHASVEFGLYMNWNCFWRFARIRLPEKTAKIGNGER